MSTPARSTLTPLPSARRNAPHEPEHTRSALRPYLRMARIDHWPKNAILLLGVVVALFFAPALTPEVIVHVMLALVATCLIASSNYVLNELTDAETDRAHPLKRTRPAAAGQIAPALAITEWIGLGALGLAVAACVHVYLTVAALALWIMGIVYNVRPLRAKDVPYVDVLTESVNHALRLLLGWFAVVQDRVVPLSLLLSYWMAGAFFLGLKRIAEYRYLEDAQVAAAYRRSFAHYTLERLLGSVFTYAVVGALFAGIFIVRYRLELMIGLPVFIAFMGYCLNLAFKQPTPLLEPEHLHRDVGFMLYALGSLLLFGLLLYVDIPLLYGLFKVHGSNTTALWSLEP